jgi:hypothetical protein
MSDRVAALAERVLKEAAAAGVSWQGGSMYGRWPRSSFGRPPEPNFAAVSSPTPKKSPHGGK